MAKEVIELICHINSEVGDIESSRLWGRQRQSLSSAPGGFCVNTLVWRGSRL